MLNVRELAKRLEVDCFEQQMGPFALVQRPAPESRVEEARAVGAGVSNL